MNFQGPTSSRNDEDGPAWAPLRDNYMLTSSKLKDWDKMQVRFQLLVNLVRQQKKRIDPKVLSKRVCLPLSHCLTVCRTQIQQMMTLEGCHQKMAVLMRTMFEQHRSVSSCTVCQKSIFVIRGRHRSCVFIDFVEQYIWFN